MPEPLSIGGAATRSWKEDERQYARCFTIQTSKIPTVQ